MLLGLSGSATGEDVDATELRSGAGVDHGELLVRLVDASFDSDEQLAIVRAECTETLGHEMTVDAIAVIANFHMMTRIADGTGTPLDARTEASSGDIRTALGLDDLVSTRFDSTVA